MRVIFKTTKTITGFYSERAMKFGGHRMVLVENEISVSCTACHPFGITFYLFVPGASTAPGAVANRAQSPEHLKLFQE